MLGSGPRVVEGMTITDVKVGTGRTAPNGMQLYIHYLGKLENGTVFDDNMQCSEPSGGPTGTAGIMPRRRDGTGPLTVVLGRSSCSGDGRARLGPPGPTR